MNPPFEISAKAVNLLAEITEELTLLKHSKLGGRYTPKLRRASTIETVQSSCAIEGNSLDIEQVSAIFDGKRVIGHPKEVLEIQNALKLYELFDDLEAISKDDLLEAHKVLMITLIDDPGVYRNKGVGIKKGDVVMHMAPPAHQVNPLMNDLMAWLKTSQDHPLIKSSVFHYEFEFIHPFSDGNGRMGRLWQSLILSEWDPIFKYIPVETLIRDHQQDYYAALNASNRAGHSGPFIDFMLEIILKAVQNDASTDQVSDQVSDQVKDLLIVIDNTEKMISEIMDKLKLKHKPSFRKSRLIPALEQGLVEMTQPDSPRSPTQKYRLTIKGKQVLKG